MNGCPDSAKRKSVHSIEPVRTRRVGQVARHRTSSQATVQLRTDSGQCMSVTLDDVKKNDPDHYRIK